MLCCAPPAESSAEVHGDGLRGSPCSTSCVLLDPLPLFRCELGLRAPSMLCASAEWSCGAVCDDRDLRSCLLALCVFNGSAPRPCAEFSVADGPEPRPRIPVFSPPDDGSGSSSACDSSGLLSCEELGAAGLFAVCSFDSAVTFSGGADDAGSPSSGAGEEPARLTLQGWLLLLEACGAVDCAADSGPSPDCGMIWRSGDFARFAALA